MTRRSLPFLLITALLVSACGAEQSTSDETSATNESTEAQSARPDPLNPAGENLAYPEGWTYRLDRPDEDAVVSADTAEADIYLATMTPGWHMTTKQPRAILYHPASTVEGNYEALSTIHLFNPGPRRNEGYGIFVGGQNLQGPDQSYLYFLLRRSGEYLIKLRSGDETETLVGWTASDAVVPYDANTQGTATNTLAIRASEDSLEFVVNDEVVETLEREGLPTEGVFGLRLNHAVNVHVEDLAVTELG